MEKTKQSLSKFRKIFFREKYRFDQGNAFLVFVNFALLVISLVRQGGGNQEYIKYFVLGGLLGTWFLGFLLDRVVRVQDIQEKVYLQRSPLWQENFSHHDGQSRKLEQLIKKLEKVEKRLEKIIDK